jgi:oligopeptide/dipeptide ABC transporter ATP-binding protein
VFCLVGESGCGKTTTGKALLRLEDTTEGDVFFEMPDGEYSRYTQSRTGPQTPDSRKAMDGLRRKYSLTWKESLRWTVPQVLILVGMIAVATALAFLLPALAMGFSAQPFAEPWAILGFGAAIGALLGGIAPLPPSRMWRRTPAILALLAIIAVFLAPILSFDFHDLLNPAAALHYNPFEAFVFAWSTNAFAMLLILIVAPSVAGALSRTLLSLRQQHEGLSGIKMRTLRRRLHLIFQDPYESLNPKQSIYEIVAEPLRVNHLVRNPEEAAARVARSLSDAGLRPPEEFMFRFPHEVSGGQRQRISIAAALVLEPDFIVADEPVSMLDVSIRTEILQLMMDLRKTRGLTYLFITHDLSLAWVLADRIAVMYLGQIVEIGTTEQVIRNPKHPYTQALMSVVPSPNPRHRSQRTILKGERPDPVNIPTGCRFHPRCPKAFESCGWSSEEVLEDLQAVIAKPLKGRYAEVTAPDPKTIRIRLKTGTSSETLVEELRGLIANHKDERLALRGIADITPGADSVTVTLHSWMEPPLVEIAPENSVACLLVNAPGKEEAPAVVP